MDELPGIHSHQVREKSRLSSGVCAHIALGGCPGPWAAAPWRCVQGNPWISWLPVHGSVCGRGERPESAPAVPTAPTGVCERATLMSGFPVSNLASPRSLSPYVHIASAAWSKGLWIFKKSLPARIQSCHPRLERNGWDLGTRGACF